MIARRGCEKYDQENPGLPEVVRAGGQEQQPGHDEKKEQEPGEGFQIQDVHCLSRPGRHRLGGHAERADIFRQLALEDQRRQAAAQGFAHHDPIAALAREPPEAGGRGILAGDGGVVGGEGAQARPSAARCAGPGWWCAARSSRPAPRHPSPRAGRPGARRASHRRGRRAACRIGSSYRPRRRPRPARASRGRHSHRGAAG